MSEENTTPNAEPQIDLQKIKDEVRAELEQGMLKQFGEQMTQFADRVTPPAAQQPEEEPTNPFSLEDDPDNYARWETERVVNQRVEAIINERLTPIAERIYSMANRTQSAEFERQNKQIDADPDLGIPEVKADFEAELAKIPEDQRIDPEVRKTFLALAKGKNSDKIKAAAFQRAMNANELDEAPAVRPLGSREKYKITPAIKKYAEAFGMDPQDYARQMEESGVAVERVSW